MKILNLILILCFFVVFIQCKTGKQGSDSTSSGKPLNSPENQGVVNDLDPDACLLYAKVVSIDDNDATVKVLEVKRCRSVTSTPKEGEEYLLNVQGESLEAANEYLFEVTVPAESKGNQLYLVKIHK